MAGSRPVILDCDPGHDDALAILLAVRHLQVLGITTVHGNQTIDKVTTNALKVLEVAGRTDIGVHPGAGRPLLGQPVATGEVHGESGLDGPDLPEPQVTPRDGHATEFIGRTIAARDDVTVVATGPLTNLALVLTLRPDLATRIREVSLMGGSLTVGNVTPVAEFNVWADPEAFRVVLRSGIPLRMVGLNLTHQALAGPAEVDRMRTLGNRTGEVAAELTEFYAGQLRTLSGVDGAYLHDPCAVAWLIDPGVIAGRDLHVEVELSGAFTRGMTVCDYRHLGGAATPGGSGGPTADATVGPPQGGPPNALVGLELDRQRFFDLLMEALASYE